MDLTRRDLLAAVGPGTAAALAGCSGRDTTDEESTTATERTETTLTAEPDATTETTTEATTTETTAEPTTEDDGETVSASGEAFDPLRTSVAPGTTVTWQNHDSGAYASHSVTSAQFHESAAEWSFDEPLRKGESVSYDFEEPGVYEYYCTIHGEKSMCGAILVGDVSLDEPLPCEES